MPRVEVWKCPRTGKLYQSTDAYLKHLREMAVENLRRRREQKRVDAGIARLVSLKTINEVEETLALVVRDYMTLQTGKKFNGPVEDHVCIAFRGMNHRDCSNTHCAPRRGARNWHGVPDVPRSYPGFYGRITIQLSEEIYKLRAGSDTVSLFGANTGSGGGGWRASTNMIELSYDVTLFEDDWPGLARTYHEEQMIKRLTV